MSAARWRGFVGCLHAGRSPLGAQFLAEQLPNDVRYLGVNVGPRVALARARLIVKADEEAHMLTPLTLGGGEAFFVDGGRVPEGPGLPPSGPPDIAKLREFAPRCGREIFGPPLTQEPTLQLYRRTSLPHRLQALAAVAYSVVFAVSLTASHPGLGIGQGFYIPILLRASSALSPSAPARV